MQHVDQFSICVEHGIYNETITIPAYRFITLIACNGLVSIGDSQISYCDSSASGIKDVYIMFIKQQKQLLYLDMHIKIMAIQFCLSATTNFMDTNSTATAHGLVTLIVDL